MNARRILSGLLSVLLITAAVVLYVAVLTNGRFW
jgi:hypothetical protein